MQRRVRLLAPLGVALVLASGCGSSSSGGDGPAGGGTVVAASLTRAKVAADDPAIAPIVDRVATELLPAVLATNDGGNVSYSPASIAAALAMTRAGATGDAATELDALFGAKPDDVHRAMNALGGLYEARTRTVGSGDDQKQVTVEGADALWGQKDLRFAQPFLDTLATNYGTGVHTVDFSGDHEGARKTINGWVGERTHDKITDLLPDSAITPDTRVVLTDALYLAAPWADEFDPAGTLPFATPSGSVDAEGLHAQDNLAYRRNGDAQVVTVPYAGGDLGFTIVLPDEGKLAPVEERIAADGLGSVLDTGGDQRLVDLTMPAFDTTSKIDLGPVLADAGVGSLIDNPTAVRGILADPDADPIVVAKVLHQATVTVDEHGTEAAAATAVIMEATAAPGSVDEPVKVVVDRPYLWVIQDLQTGTPLFVGRITNPTAE